MWEVVLSLACVSSLSLYLWFRSRPVEWTKVGRVSHIYLYPLKSGKYRLVESAICRQMGLRVGQNVDRVFAAAKSRNYDVLDQISQRRLSLVVLNVCEDGSTVTLEAPGQETFTFQLPEDFNNLPEQNVVKTADAGIGGSGPCLSAYDCGDAVSGWLSQFLKGEDTGVRLLFHHQLTSAREHGQRFLTVFGNTMEESHKPAFGNTSPYLVITQASVDDLNTRLAKPVDHKQFRPNIVVETTDKSPYQEDNWRLVRIGDTVLQYSLPNIRCASINVEQDTAERDQHEPLATLKKYRCVLSDKSLSLCQSFKYDGKKAAIFGTKYGLDQEGTTINVGQDVYAQVLQKKLYLV